MKRKHIEITKQETKVKCRLSNDLMIH